MDTGNQEQLQRKKRREELLKLHFRDLAPEDQLRLLRELIGHMEYDLVRDQGSSATGSPAPAAPGPQTRPAPTVTGPLPPSQPASAAAPAATYPPPPGAPVSAVPPARPAPATARQAAPAPAASGPAANPVARITDDDPAWQEFDREMDEVLQAGGDYHQVHHLRLQDAAARYSSLLKRHGYIKGFPGIEELARQARLAADSPKVPPPEWSDWVARDADTLDRPLSHQWAEWLLPGSDADQDTGAD